MGLLPGEPAWAGAATAAFQGSEAQGTGLFALDGIVPEIFNLMAIPEAPLMADLGVSTYAAAGAYCRNNLAFLLVDHPETHDAVGTITDWDIASFLGTDLSRGSALCFHTRHQGRPAGVVIANCLPVAASRASWRARMAAGECGNPPPDSMPHLVVSSQA